VDSDPQRRQPQFLQLRPDTRSKHTTIMKDMIIILGRHYVVKLHPVPCCYYARIRPDVLYGRRDASRIKESQLLADSMRVWRSRCGFGCAGRGEGGGTKGSPLGKDPSVVEKFNLRSGPPRLVLGQHSLLQIGKGPAPLVALRIFPALPPARSW
jgi:hypothetical protein